jgi:nitrogen fixation protein FixH
MTSTITHGTFTGRHMLTIMIAFFLVVLSANLCLVYYSSHSWTGLVVENSYVASQEFDATTKKLEEAAADIHASQKYTNGQLLISLTDNAGRTVAASNLTIALGRPSHEGEDHRFELLQTATGIYTAQIHLAKGQWSGTISGSVLHHENWQRPVRLFVKD